MSGWTIVTMSLSCTISETLSLTRYVTREMVSSIEPIFTEKRAVNDFYILVPSDLDLLPFDLKFAHLVTGVRGHIPPNLKFLRLYDFD